MIYVYLIPQVWFDMSRDAFYVTYDCLDNENGAKSPSHCTMMIL